MRSQVGHVAAGVVLVALAVGVGDGVRLGAVGVQAGTEFAVGDDVVDGRAVLGRYVGDGGFGDAANVS